MAYGHHNPNDANSELGAIVAIVRGMMAEMVTSKLVLVQAVTGGGLAGAGTVDVLPLVQQVDGNGYGTSHGTVPGLPWSRLQGGKNAVICDPAVGDVGYLVAMDRDTSKVRATGAEALPGTFRQFDVADGVYVGACLAVTPDQYLIFTETGVRLVDKNGNSVTMDDSGMKLVDLFGNKYTSSAAGVTIADVNANQMQMVPGFVNFVTPLLKVNGVIVIVP